MVDYLIHFFKYNKIYLITGIALLLLVIIPTKEKISAKTQKALYLGIVIWIICFAYRMSTGEDIIYLFKNKDTWENENKPIEFKSSPFNKYYSNDAGRNTKGKSTTDNNE
jgi:amino acid permease